MFPKKGNVFPNSGDNDGHPINYAAAIATALRDELGTTHQAVKAVMRWTGASERTVKNWLSGMNGPSSEHLLALARHSGRVFEVLLRLAGRDQVIIAMGIVDSRNRLVEIFEAIQSLLDVTEPPADD